MNESLYRSACTITLSPWMIGELECPHCVSGSKNQPLSSTPMSVFQSGLPSMSQAASMPIEPNIATTRLPSVTGVEFAWLALVCRFTFGAPVKASAPTGSFPSPCRGSRSSRCARTDR